MGSLIRQVCGCGRYEGGFTVAHHHRGQDSLRSLTSVPVPVKRTLVPKTSPCQAKQLFLLGSNSAGEFSCAVWDQPISIESVMSAEMIPVKGCDSVRMNTGNAKLVKEVNKRLVLQLIRRNGPFQEQIWPEPWAYPPQPCRVSLMS